MKTRIKLLFYILLMTTSLKSFCQKNFPINTNGSLVDTIKVYQEKDKLKFLGGKFYAFDAKIIELYEAYNGKPYYLAEFADGNKIWIASLIKSDYQKKGAILRMLGVFSNVMNDDKISKNYNDQGYHILLFSFVDIDSKKSLTFSGGEEQANEWRDGNIPDDLD